VGTLADANPTRLSKQSQVVSLQSLLLSLDILLPPQFASAPPSIAGSDSSLAKCHMTENTQLNNINFFLFYIIINFSLLNSCCLLL